MWSSIIDAVKSRLGLDNSENNTKLDNSGNRKQSILTGEVSYNNTGWRKDKASQASLQEDISKGRTVSISAPQSSRYSFDSKGVADLVSGRKDADDFKEIGLKLEAGNGYYFLSRAYEGKQSIEQKLDSFSKWLDYLDFLKCYNQSFTAGFQFRKSHIVEQISVDLELKQKAGRLFKKYDATSNQDIVTKLIQEMVSIGYAECINETDETYKVTSAFRYAEELVNMIQIANEDEIPE